MNSSDINRLLRGSSNGDDLKSKIYEDVSAYRLLMDKKGSSIPLKFYEDEEITVDNSGIRRLLNATLSGKLSNVDLAYICDCLILAERIEYESEKVQDIIFSIADPEINGGFLSDNDLQRVLDECK